MLRLLFGSVAITALSVAPAQAQTVFIAELTSEAENPPAASQATGSALVVFDPTFQTMRVRTTFNGLTTPTVDGHIHCCAPTTANAGVAVGFRPTGFPLGVTSGQYDASFDLNAVGIYGGGFLAANGGTAATARTALINGTQSGLAYVNVHTTRFPGGEIRGQLLTGPDLTPQAYTLLPEVALQTAEFQETSIRRYLGGARGGGLDGESARLGDDGKIGMFLIGGQRFGEFGSSANRPLAKLGSAGAIVGIDYRLGSSALIGVMGGIDSTDARLTAHSRQSEVDSWFAGAYGSLSLGSAYLDLQISYTKSDYDLFRRISVGRFNAESVAETESKQWMIAATAGFNLDAGGFEIEPYAGVRYVDLGLDAFAETGNIAALTIGATDVKSLQSIVGLRLGADIPAGNVSVRPSIRGEWRHEFENDDSRLISSSFGGIGSFSFATTPLGADHVVVGAGLAISGGGPLSLTVDYTGQLSGGYEIHAVTGGVRLTF